VAPSAGLVGPAGLIEVEKMSVGFAGQLSRQLLIAKNGWKRDPMVVIPS